MSIFNTTKNNTYNNIIKHCGRIKKNTTQLNKYCLLYRVNIRYLNYTGRGSIIDGESDSHWTVVV